VTVEPEIVESSDDGGVVGPALIGLGALGAIAVVILFTRRRRGSDAKNP
jgi:hypothetical protein